MQVSVREVFQLSDRCFSAAGFAEGPAWANAETMWWTEAYKGSGLTMLHGLLDDLSELDRTALSLRDQSSRVSVIDSADQPSIVSSSPALDLSCSQAKRHGIGIVYSTISHADETLPALGHIVHKGIERGVLPIVISADGNGRAKTIVGTPDHPQPLIAELDLAAPSRSYVALLDMIQRGFHQQRHSPLTQVFFDGSEDVAESTADTQLLARLLRRATAPTEGRRADVDPGFITLCVEPTHPQYSAGVRSVFDRFLENHETAFTTVFHPQHVQDRTETLLQDGIEIDREVWRDIFECSSEILAPPFEGSHRGAGFSLDE